MKNVILSAILGISALISLMAIPFVVVPDATAYALPLPIGLLAAAYIVASVKPKK